MVNVGCMTLTLTACDLGIDGGLNNGAGGRLSDNCQKCTLPGDRETNWKIEKPQTVNIVAESFPHKHNKNIKKLTLFNTKPLRDFPTSKCAFLFFSIRIEKKIFSV